MDNRVIARKLVHQLRGRQMTGAGACSPIGLLTHHLVHDRRVWRLCDELLDMLRKHRAVEFIDLADWSNQHAANFSEAKF